MNTEKLKSFLKICFYFSSRRIGEDDSVAHPPSKSAKDVPHRDLHPCLQGEVHVAHRILATVTTSRACISKRRVLTSNFSRNHTLSEEIVPSCGVTANMLQILSACIASSLTGWKHIDMSGVGQCWTHYAVHELFGQPDHLQHNERQVSPSFPRYVPVLSTQAW